MPYPVIICDNTTNLNERTLVTKLKNSLGTKNINVGICEPNLSDTRTKQLLLDAQWLVFVLTPEAIKSPWLQSLVNFGFECVKQGQMQGVLALALSSDPVDPDDMPSPLWSTIRTYYTGDSEEEKQRAFEKLARTLGYNRVPILAHAQSTPADNWASSSGTLESAGSRPLPAYPTPIRKRRPPFIAAVTIVIALLFIVGGTTLGITFFKGVSSTSHVISTPKHGHPKAPVPSKATLTPTPSPQELYTSVISMHPILNDPLKQGNNNKWETKDQCVFKSGMYHVTALASSSGAASYTTCMDMQTSYITNFAYQVQLSFTGGNAGGLIFLSNDVVTTFYRFSLDSAGNWALRLCQNCLDYMANNGKGISSGKENPNNGQDITINPSYTLTVIVNNKTIYLYVEGTFVYQVKNSLSGPGGEIGVYADSGTQSSEVAFNDAKVWTFRDPANLSNQSP